MMNLSNFNFDCFQFLKFNSNSHYFQIKRLGIFKILDYFQIINIYNANSGWPLDLDSGNGREFLRELGILFNLQ